jgi:hypothetical protein
MSTKQSIPERLRSRFPWAIFAAEVYAKIRFSVPRRRSALMIEPALQPSPEPRIEF